MIFLLSFVLGLMGLFSPIICLVGFAYVAAYIEHKNPKHSGLLNKIWTKLVYVCVVLFILLAIFGVSSIAYHGLIR